MENQIDIVKDIADGMIGIGGIPSNEEFYAEFDMRLRAALKIETIEKKEFECASRNLNNGVVKCEIIS